MVRPAPPPPAPAPKVPSLLEVHPHDVPLGVGAALLAVSTFLPWYRGPLGVEVSASGWATGSLGPVVFFLGLASLAIIVLRRAGVALSLPTEESLVHEGFGYAAVLAVLVKARFRPGLPPELGGIRMGVGWGIWLAVVAGIAVALLAARMGPRAPLVLRPGWYRAAGGRLGASVLGLALVCASAFGVTQSFDLQAALQARQTPGPTGNIVRGRLPGCARRIPVPRGVKALAGVEPSGQQAVCVAQLGSSLTPARLAALYKRELRKAGWTFTVPQQQGSFQTLSLTGPRCGSMYFVQAQSGGSVAQVALTECRQPTPTG